MADRNPLVTTTQRTEHPDPGERGFGLIEVVVSMFLLGLLAIAFLPLLITSLQTTVRNSTVATASQLVSQQLDEVRGIQPYCEAVTAFDATAVAPVTDARGTSYQPHREVGPCPAADAYPAVVPVTVWLTQDGEPDKLYETRTLVYVQALTVPTP